MKQNLYLLGSDVSSHPPSHEQYTASEEVPLHRSVFPMMVSFLFKLNCVILFKLKSIF